MPSFYLNDSSSRALWRLCFGKRGISRSTNSVSASVREASCVAMPGSLMLHSGSPLCPMLFHKEERPGRVSVDRKEAHNPLSP